MVNPLHGFISKEGRLFQEFDSEGKGIDVYRGRGVLTALFDYVFGKAERVSVAGDVISIDRESAEKFFDRNKDLFKDTQEMSLKEKLLYLLGRNKKFPRNVLEEDAVGGEEAKRTLVGEKQQFIRLAQALQKNAFEVEHLLKLIQEKGEGFLSIERKVFFSQIVEENKGRLGELTDFIGDDRICRLANLLIRNIRKELFPSE